MSVQECTEFIVPVVYVQPEFEELKRRFPAFVSPDYMGKRFDSIESCRAVSKENREVSFEIVRMDCIASTDEALVEMDRLGLRPALYEELLAFAEKYPDERMKYSFVAIGSETLVEGRRRVAYLWRDGGGQRFCLRWVDRDWGDGGNFLAVRR